MVEWIGPDISFIMNDFFLYPLSPKILWFPPEAETEDISLHYPDLFFHATLS